jgi:BolA protein
MDGDPMMSVKARIEGKLTTALAPLALEVIDDSHQHAGHIGHPASGHPGALSASETHFTVKVVSAAFSGKPRLARHRLINEILAEDLRTGVHALAIEARAPGE